MVLYTGVTTSFVTMSRTLGGGRILQNTGWGIQPINQTGIFTGVTTQEAAPCGCLGFQSKCLALRSAAISMG